MNNDRKPRRGKSPGRDGRSRGKTKRRKIVPAKSLCPHCKVGRMKHKGSYDTAGAVSWKCNKCGRRVKKRRIPKAPEPVVPTGISPTGG